MKKWIILITSLLLTCIFFVAYNKNKQSSLISLFLIEDNVVSKWTWMLNGFSSVESSVQESNILFSKSRYDSTLLRLINQNNSQIVQFSKSSGDSSLLYLINQSGDKIGMKSLTFNATKPQEVLDLINRHILIEDTVRLVKLNSKGIKYRIKLREVDTPIIFSFNNNSAQLTK